MISHAVKCHNCIINHDIAAELTSDNNENVDI